MDAGGFIIGGQGHPPLPNNDSILQNPIAAGIRMFFFFGAQIRAYQP